MPTSPNGEWWELMDEERGIPFYYHSQTGSTVWTKPAQAKVISLTLLQQSVLGQRVSLALSNRASFHLANEALGDSAPSEQSLVHDASDHASIGSFSQSAASDSQETVPKPTDSVLSSDMGLKPMDRRDTLLNSAFPEESPSMDNLTGFSVSAPTVPEQLPSAPVPIPPTRPSSASVATIESLVSTQSAGPLLVPKLHPPVTPIKSTVSIESLPSRPSPARAGPLHRKSLLGLRVDLTRPDSLMSVSTMATDISVNDTTSPGWDKPARSVDLRRTSYFSFSGGRTTRALSQLYPSDIKVPGGPFKQSEPTVSQSSPSLHTRRLPEALQHDIAMFQIDGFAKDYFATHKRGLFRRRVPLQEMLRFTSQSLKKPLVRLPYEHRKDAVRCFKVVQRIMGDRSRGSQASDATDTQWLLDRGIRLQVLRDEIYVQLCKQLTENPQSQSIDRGWLLLCVVCQVFPPSAQFASYLHAFLHRHTNTPIPRINTMARFALGRVQRVAERGARTKVPSVTEIGWAKQIPFTRPLFGEALETIMQYTPAVDVDLGIPRVLTYLTDLILQLNGQQSEGIFRVPGDAEQVDQLKQRLDLGDYATNLDLRDPNIPGSLLKQWLRELPHPLILHEYHATCVQNPQDPETVLKVMSNLRGVRLRVADYMVQFLQVFAKPDNSRLSRMDISNLAMVFAPAFLTCPSGDLKEAFANSQAEQLFLKTLLKVWKGVDLVSSHPVI
ncbi:hypothetical protein H4R34_004579 [Dimargaris verticillata]|uniref:Rho GTPase activation protein n=1 Tax=Dimargaris verticillata TaxID=2761393 RepID=A0A9W8AYJ8_9FUNG|nr:hypothetical protein H4R34_004579 [Dimargaris verticillata]